MTATTTPTPPRPTLDSLQGAHSSFGGILRSEWIKLRSLRSTFWCAVIILVLTVGFAALLALTLGPRDGIPKGAALMPYAVQSVTLSTGFTSLVAAVLGALMITGEYGTGMIRSTFAAVPARLPALLGKAVVVTLAMFVIAAVSALAAALVGAGIFAARGSSVDFGDGGYWLALLGDAGYVALIGLLALMIGAIIRNSAGGIATALGLILVLPTVATLFAALAGATWAQNVGAFLPSNAGSRMMGYLPAGQPAPPAPAGHLTLEPWQGLLVMLAWIVAAGILAGVLMRRRDA
jgi:ABC-2 type transport system permease protein